MLKLFQKKSHFYCFTPEVMMATFIIETVLAIYVFVRYRMSKFGRIAGLILILLAAFQIAEYQICANTQPLLWARIGFVAITLLPILSLHLVVLASKKTHFLKLGYAIALGFILYIIFSPQAIISAVCGGNYVMFQLGMNTYWLYGIYYAFFLSLVMWKAYKGILTAKEQNKNKAVLYWMIIGYLFFIIPTAIIYVFSGTLLAALASIMCGFALLLAFIIAFKIAPKYHRLFKINT